MRKGNRSAWWRARGSPAPQAQTCRDIPIAAAGERSQRPARRRRTQAPQGAPQLLRCLPPPPTSRRCGHAAGRTSSGSGLRGERRCGRRENRSIQHIASSSAKVFQPAAGPHLWVNKVQGRSKEAQLGNNLLAAVDGGIHERSHARLRATPTQMHQNSVVTKQARKQREAPATCARGRPATRTPASEGQHCIGRNDAGGWGQGEGGGRAGSSRNFANAPNHNGCPGPRRR